jgi:hypothetical protein
MVQQAQISLGDSAAVDFELIQLVPPAPRSHKSSSKSKSDTGSSKSKSNKDSKSNTDSKSKSNTDKSNTDSSISTKKIPRKKRKSRSHSHKKSDKPEKPAIVWLMSYPNSGTSYTMTMVERASNRSTATNYGVEVTSKEPGISSIPVNEDHPEGPYWEGLSGKLGTPRELPDNYVLTKTHCSGRCVHCGPDEYVVDTQEFLEGCTRTSARTAEHRGFQVRRVQAKHEPDRVARMVHLIRNPFANVVARFHLERRHLVRADPDKAEALSNDAAGFAKWCQTLDEEHAVAEPNFFTAEQLAIYRQAPCRGEFYKYTQWHNRVNDITPLVGPGSKSGSGSPPVLIIHYEDYASNLQETADQLLKFLELPLVAPIRPFRELPDYSDHFSRADIKAVKALVRNVASEHTYKLVERYFE